MDFKLLRNGADGVCLGLSHISLPIQSIADFRLPIANCQLVCLPHLVGLTIEFWLTLHIKKIVSVANCWDIASYRLRWRLTLVRTPIGNWQSKIGNAFYSSPIATRGFSEFICA